MHYAVFSLGYVYGKICQDDKYEFMPTNLHYTLAII
jgi:hypothetical protein